MPQRPTLDQLYGGGAPRSAPSLDDLYGGTTAGGFDERRLAELEKEFGLKTPAPYVHKPSADLPQSPLDLLLRPLPQVSNAARSFSDWITNPASDRGMVEGYARGALGGAAEGVATLLSPLNVLSTATGLGAARGTKQIKQAMDLVRGPGSYAARDAAAQSIAPLQRSVSGLQAANAMTALPSMAHGGVGVAADPSDPMAWAELGGGALGAFFGFKGGTMPPEAPRPRAPKPPEPLGLPQGRMEAGIAGANYVPPMPKGGPMAPAPRGARPSRNINEPLRAPVDLSVEELTPGSVSSGYEPTGAPAPARSPFGRDARNINQPLRAGMSLDDIYGPINPQPMPGGSLEMAPDFPVAPPSDRFPRGRVVPDAQASLERGEPLNAELTRFFGMTPENPVGTGLSDVGQMDLGRRPQPGSMLPGEPPRPAPPGGGNGLWTGREFTEAPRSPVPTAQDVMASASSQMPGAAEIRAAREAMARGEEPPSAIRRFFGMGGDDAPPAPLDSEISQPSTQPPAPTIGRMSLDRLRELLGGARGIGLTDELAPMRRMTGDKIPPDLRQEVANILDEMEMQPYQRGEVIDTQARGFEGAGGGMRDSVQAGGLMFEPHPDNPNLIRHFPGAPVHHDIGGSQPRSKTIEAIQRMLNGGRATDLTDRVMDVAGRRVAGRGPGTLPDVMGNDMAPGRAVVPGAPEGPRPLDLPEVGGVGRIDLDPMPGGQQRRLPGDVGDVRNLEAPLPPVADVPEQGFNLTAPRETQPIQPGLLAGGGAPPSPDVDPRIRSLYDDLFVQWRASEAKMAAEGNPLVGGDLFESLGEFAERLKTADPRSLMGKERAVRKILDSEAGFMGGDLGLALGGAASGAAAGGTDDEHPVLGAVGGGLAGLLLGRAGAKLLRGGVSAPRVPRRPLTVPREDLGALGSGDALDEAFRITRAGKGGLTPEPVGGKRFSLGDLSDDAGFVEIPDAETFKQGMSKIGNATERLGYFSMLGAPSTIAKGHIGAGSAGVMRALEEIAAGRVGVGTDILKNMGSRRSAGAYRRALSEGSADPTATRWGSTEGVLGTPSRMMAAPDAWVTESMIDAGIPLESAKRSAFTAEPRSQTGQRIVELQRGLGPVGRTIAFPFARTAVNLTERGIERTPGLGLIAEMLAKDPSAGRDILARQGLGLGAGVLGYSQGEDDGMMNPYALTAMGPYAVPAAIGAALRGIVDKPKSTPGKSAASRALTDVAQGVLSQSPLPTEGYQLDRLLDPRNWPSRYLPRVLSMFETPGDYQTPGLMDPTIARIPFLNDALLKKKKKRGSGVTFSAPGDR